jgi:hypothetical protein
MIFLVLLRNDRAREVLAAELHQRGLAPVPSAAASEADALEARATS